MELRARSHVRQLILRSSSCSALDWFGYEMRGDLHLPGEDLVHEDAPVVSSAGVERGLAKLLQQSRD